jgi:DNA-binding LytR/AlgR family response regulator
MGETSLAKILVVEDDALIAMELAERLTDLGHAVLGPAHTLSEAERLVARERPDAALLDANLAGQSSVGLGAALAGQGVAVAFCTGYDTVRGAPPELASAPVLTKPYSDAELKDTLAKLMAG